MAFNGFLLKVGDFEFPPRYIEYATYQGKLNVQDLDPRRDANGKLHRNSLEHTIVTVTFSIKPNLTNEQIGELMQNIRNNYTNELERRALVTAFVPELNDYVTQEMYLADPLFTIKEISDIIKYDRTTFNFIGY